MGAVWRVGESRDGPWPGQGELAAAPNAAWMGEWYNCRMHPPAGGTPDFESHRERDGRGSPGSEGGVWRALDATANRAGEALRVLEDVLRFVLDDVHLTGIAKGLRHDLAAVLATGGLARRATARDVGADVGPRVVGVEALPRLTVGDLVAANAARAAQALRSLQECALVLLPPLASRFEALRYRLYDLERAVLTAVRARERLEGVTLCVLVDGRRDRDAFGRLVDGLFGAGVRMIQVRDKALGVPELADRVALAVDLARRRGGPARPIVVVNDRPDVAVASHADGVHVGAEDLPVALVRRVVGPDLLVGRTAHDIDEARAAARAGADSLGVGPCFPSSTKAFSAHAPREFLAAAASIALPSFAIGGVTVDRLDVLLATGLRRVAVAAAITDSDDPPTMAARFLSRLSPRGEGTP